MMIKPIEAIRGRIIIVEKTIAKQDLDEKSIENSRIIPVGTFLVILTFVFLWQKSRPK